jgi:ribosome modulation factor
VLAPLLQNYGIGRKRGMLAQGKNHPIRMVPDRFHIRWTHMSGTALFGSRVQAFANGHAIGMDLMRSANECPIPLHRFLVRAAWLDGFEAGRSERIAHINSQS